MPGGIIQSMKVAIGSDHAGYTVKEEIVRFIAREQIPFKDLGAHSPEPFDYPDVAILAAEAVANGEYDRAILVCATGIGMSITANKVPGIRAALCVDVDCAMLSRDHNDANVLALAGRLTKPAAAVEIVRAWLATGFPGEQRHVRRLRKIADLERKYSRSGG